MDKMIRLGFFSNDSLQLNEVFCSHLDLKWKLIIEKRFKQQKSIHGFIQRDLREFIK